MRRSTTSTLFISYLFQSTHPHGVRRGASEAELDALQFQSTHPHGVRPVKGIFTLDWKEMFQSTHPHGVRPNGNQEITGPVLFQSTHPHGVRPNGNQEITGPVLFQSTHPHGVRLSASLSFRCVCRFNPRTHTGCDENVTKVNIEVGVSIHAPTRGATPEGGTIEVSESVSIHAPTRGATNWARGWMRRRWFQSTHPHGVRPFNIN